MPPNDAAPTEGTALLPTSEEAKPTASQPATSTPEDRARCRLFLFLILFSVVLILTAILAIWHAHAQKKDVRAHRANAALQKINHHTAKDTTIPAGCETTLILFRHCEKHGPYVTSKEDRSEHCSYVGLERAAYLATLFDTNNNNNNGGTTNQNARYPAPAHLFALNPDRSSHLNFREYETLHPLAQATGTMIELADHPTLAKDYREMLQSGSLCGRVTVVSWKHSHLVDLATRLGCGPQHGCPDVYEETEFDKFFQLKYVFHPTTTSTTDADADATLAHNTRPLDRHHHHRHDHNDTTIPPAPPPEQHRSLLGINKHSISHKGWNVYGSVARMNFDPLAFSYASGDYPPTGSPRGGAWMNAVGGEL